MRFLVVDRAVEIGSWVLVKLAVVCFGPCVELLRVVLVTTLWVVLVVRPWMKSVAALFGSLVLTGLNDCPPYPHPPVPTGSLHPDAPGGNLPGPPNGGPWKGGPMGGSP